MFTFTELKKELSDIKRDRMYVNMEYFLDAYRGDVASYNYLISVYWKIAKYNLEILKEQYG